MLDSVLRKATYVGLCVPGFHMVIPVLETKRLDRRNAVCLELLLHMLGRDTRSSPTFVHEVGWVRQPV